MFSANVSDKHSTGIQCNSEIKAALACLFSDLIQQRNDLTRGVDSRLFGIFDRIRRVPDSHDGIADVFVDVTAMLCNDLPDHVKTGVDHPNHLVIGQFSDIFVKPTMSRNATTT